LDDVRIYNRAFSDDDAEELYIATNEVTDGDCVDSNNQIHPLVEWYLDADADGYGDI
jgi:hypothetical protein